MFTFHLPLQTSHGDSFERRELLVSVVFKAEASLHTPLRLTLDGGICWQYLARRYL